MERPVADIDVQALQSVLARHLAIYRSKPPTYQTTMLNDLAAVWKGRPARLLDVGGGTGVIAQAVSELFPVEVVEAVDVADRFCPTLSIAVQQYDGARLPYADGAFDSAMLNNVMHHVRVEQRVALLQEIHRVVRGPIYIKDHEQNGLLDILRLTILDVIGNIPFGGMLWARYLGGVDWKDLALASGYQIAARKTGRYRRGIFALIFPNKLEITMRFDPLGQAGGAA